MSYGSDEINISAALSKQQDTFFFNALYFKISMLPQIWCLRFFKVFFFFFFLAKQKIYFVAQKQLLQNNAFLCEFN